MLHAADKKPQRTVPVSWLLLHPPPVTAASQNPQIRAKLSHWWWLEQTELEWRGRELLLSAQLETAMQKLHLLLYSWTFFHLVNMQWSPRILCLPPRCLLYINYLDTPSLNRSPSSKAAAQEATADVVYSGPTWCPANASRKAPEKALLPRELSWGCSSAGASKPALEEGLVREQVEKLQLGTISLTQHFAMLQLPYRNTNSSADHCTAEFKLK